MILVDLVSPYFGGGAKCRRGKDLRALIQKNKEEGQKNDQPYKAHQVGLKQLHRRP
jgi:hypothetical protein